jgi:hypothetical protein
MRRESHEGEIGYHRHPPLTIEKYEDTGMRLLREGRRTEDLL